MDIDKPMVIGERREVRQALIVSIVMMPAMVWIFSLNPANWWAWILGVISIAVFVLDLVKYLRFKKGTVVGTTISIDAEGITFEQIGKPQRKFRWKNMDSLNIDITEFIDMKLTFRIRHDKLPKEHEASYTYTKGNAVGLLNLSKLRRKIEHFSGGRISPHYNSRAASIARFHNILYIG
jgi:hypothetical protein